MAQKLNLQSGFKVGHGCNFLLNHNVVAEQHVLGPKADLGLEGIMSTFEFPAMTYQFAGERDYASSTQYQFTREIGLLKFVRCFNFVQGVRLRLYILSIRLDSSVFVQNC